MSAFDIAKKYIRSDPNPAAAVPDYRDLAEPGAFVVDQLVEQGEVKAVLICSTVLEAHVWLAFDDNFDPPDDQVVFYAHELSALREKTPEQLRSIFKTKAVFRGEKVRE